MSEVPFVQSVLFKSPYSGCGKFSGWQKAPCAQMPVQTSWPSPYNAPGALACVDRGRRHPGGSQNVSQAHFRPSRPYPSFVLGPGGDPLVPMPRAWTQKVGRPPYNLRALSFPSTTGAWNTRITGGISGNPPDAVICSIGQFNQHNLGLS